MNRSSLRPDMLVVYAWDGRGRGEMCGGGARTAHHSWYLHGEVGLQHERVGGAYSLGVGPINGDSYLQARTAPVQRLADAVAGRFAVGVMAAAAATLVFWAVAGPGVFPQVSLPPSVQQSIDAALCSLCIPCLLLLVLHVPSGRQRPSLRRCTAREASPPGTHGTSHCERPRIADAECLGIRRRLPSTARRWGLARPAVACC